MNRRKFVNQTSLLALGLGVPALAFARTSAVRPLCTAEENMLRDFSELLYSYPSGGALTRGLTTIQKINPSDPGVLDFQDINGNRISLRKVKGRLLAKLH